MDGLHTAEQKIEKMVPRFFEDIICSKNKSNLRVSNQLGSTLNY